MSTEQQSVELGGVVVVSPGAGWLQLSPVSDNGEGHGRGGVVDRVVHGVDTLEDGERERDRDRELD